MGRSRIAAAALLVVTTGFLASGCGSSDPAPPAVDPPVTKPTYKVGGTVSGLVGTGLVLRNNGGDDLAIGANGAFTFSGRLASGAAYAVTVLAQPTNPSQACTVMNGAGTVGNANVATVAVACATSTFSVGGSVSGLAGTGLVLQMNGSGDLAFSASGSFTFASSLASGAAYAVTVLSQPTSPSQVCTVTNGSGTVGGGNVTGVGVACVTSTFTVSGTVNRNAASGLVLQNNGGDDLAVSASGDFTFTFATPVASGAAYAVTVRAHPKLPRQRCSVTNGSGIVGSANVSGITVTCVAIVPRFAYVANAGDGTVSMYAVSTVSGQLRHNGYVLAGGGPQSVAVDPAGRFAYVANMTSGDVSAYAIDSSNGRLRSIGSATPAGTRPVSITVHPTGWFVYVANGGSDSVSTYAIDSSTGALTSVGTPLAVGPAPASVAVEPSGKFAYVAMGGSDVLSAYSIDSITGALTGIGTFGAGQQPRAVTVDPYGKFVYVANYFSGYFRKPPEVSAYTLDSITGVLTATGPVIPVWAGNYPISITVDPAGRFAYLLYQTYSPNIRPFSIDSATGGLTDAGLGIDSGYASSLTIDPSGNFAYTTDSARSEVSAFTRNPGNGAMIAHSTITGRRGGFAMSMTEGTSPVNYSPRFAFVANQTSNDVSVYTIKDGALVSAGPAVAAGTAPYAVAADPAGRFAYVANHGSNDVSAYAIDSISGALTSVGTPIAAGTNPFSATVDPSGRFVYVANYGSGNVSGFAIAPVTGALTSVGAAVATGTNPYQVAVDPLGRFAYVANYGSASVSAFSIDSVTGVLTSIGAAVAAGVGPSSVNVDPSGRYAYVANGASGNASTFRIDQTTGALTPYGAAVATGTKPRSIAITATIQ
jgi:6-phosphogluconolactonase (cycloisomerase 2 family)